MIVVAAVAAGAVAAVIRWAVSRAFARRGFPWAVLVVNAAGSAIGGVVLALATGDIRLVVLGGFCGGLTTFSTFTVETVQFVLDGRSRTALLSIGANLVLGIGAAAAAYAIAGLLA